MSARNIESKIHPQPDQEDRSAQWVGGWLIPAIAVLFTILWSLTIYFLIGDRPTHWNYGVMPYIPGQSYSSTRTETTQPPPKQVEYPVNQATP